MKEKEDIQQTKFPYIMIILVLVELCPISLTIFIHLHIILLHIVKNCSNSNIHYCKEGKNDWQNDFTKKVIDEFRIWPLDFISKINFNGCHLFNRNIADVFFFLTISINCLKNDCSKCKYYSKYHPNLKICKFCCGR